MYELSDNMSLVKISERKAAEAGPDDRPSTPDIEQLMEWESEGGCEATDGCWVEPDGTCPHGCQSWLLEFGMI